MRYFHGCYLIGDDTLWGVNRRKKGAANTLAALRLIRAARPDGVPIYVILDNLSAHKGDTIRRWAKKNKVELCFTPTCASWANPIEVRSGPLRQFTITNSNHHNHTTQTRALQAYLRWRNANARHPDVLAASVESAPASAVRGASDGADKRGRRLDHSLTFNVAQSATPSSDSTARSRSRAAIVSEPSAISRSRWQ